MLENTEQKTVTKNDTEIIDRDYLTKFEQAALNQRVAEDVVYDCAINEPLFDLVFDIYLIEMFTDKELSNIELHEIEFNEDFKTLKDELQSKLTNYDEARNYCYTYCYELAQHYNSLAGGLEQIKEQFNTSLEKINGILDDVSKSAKNIKEEDLEKLGNFLERMKKQGISI